MSHMALQTRARRVVPPGAAHVRRASVLLVAGFLASALSLPWTALALLPLGWSAYESMRALLQMRAAHAPGRALALPVFGLVVTGMLAASVVLPYAFYDATKSYQDCIAGANTQVATAQCRTSLYGGLRPMLGELGRTAR